MSERAEKSLDRDEVRLDLMHYTRVAYESGERVPADEMRGLLRLTIDLIERVFFDA